ncbi:MAG: class I SAM-dependent methyltransferase [Verrucomicrobiota bacterium]|nr:class I SAM-dependent methyltransferase [Verrucomicrobiota bacterium]
MNSPIGPNTSYATVRDFCDSADHLPEITGLNGDLKNVQRPWMVKSLLRCVPPPARILEVGGGEPIVSSLLAELGYDVTLVDPYNGLLGHGPTDYEEYCAAFPNVRIVRDYFRSGTPAIAGEQFDAIFSVSVLEHVMPHLGAICFEGIRDHLSPGGYSVHCFDLVLEGARAHLHRDSAARLLESQAALGGTTPEDVDVLLSRIRNDLETFYLSPQGHQQWRGNKAYDEFPFRKVVSVQTVASYVRQRVEATAVYAPTAAAFGAATVPAQ